MCCCKYTYTLHLFVWLPSKLLEEDSTQISLWRAVNELNEETTNMWLIRMSWVWSIQHI